MSAPSIQGIAFDLGGVLFEDGTKVLLQELDAAHRDRVQEILRSRPARDLRSGTMAEDDFWHWCEGQLRADEIPMTSSELRSRWYEAYRVDESMHDLLRRLAGRYFCIAFSGNVKTRIEVLDAKHPFRRYFDLEVYSYEAGSTKPEPSFVETLLQRVELHGLEPHRLAYIDDKETALAPARSRGVNTILHRTGETQATVSRLRQLGIHV